MDTPLGEAFRAWRKAVDGRDSTRSEVAAIALIAHLDETIFSRSKRALLLTRTPPSEAISHEDLDDLCQSCRIALVSALYRFDPAKGNLLDYLLTVVDGAIKATLADGTAISTPGLHVEDLPETLPQLAVDWQESSDLAILIQDALAHLPGTWAHIMRRRYFEGYTQEETAGLVGLSQSTVSRIEQQALRVLQDVLIEDPRGK